MSTKNIVEKMLQESSLLYATPMPSRQVINLWDALLKEWLNDNGYAEYAADKDKYDELITKAFHRQFLGYCNAPRMLDIRIALERILPERNQSDSNAQDRPTEDCEFAPDTLVQMTTCGND